MKMNRRTLKLPQALAQRGLTMKLGRTEYRYSIAASLRNVSFDSIVVDPLGTILKPDDPSFQRLFVVGQNMRAGIIHVPPRKSAAVLLTTVCMDEDLRDPMQDVRYLVSNEEAPRELIKAARLLEASRSTLGDGHDYLIQRNRLMIGLREVELVAHRKMVLS